MLDVGVGDGHFGSILFPQGVDAGVDPSAESVEEARRRGVYGELRVASACALPYPDSAFRSVLSNCVLEHIPDLDAALSEIARVLEPGGFFAFTVPSPNYERFLLGYSIPQALRLGALARAYGAFMTRISYHYHYYSPEEWSRRRVVVIVIRDASHERPVRSCQRAVPGVSSTPARSARSWDWAL